ncbi:MAG: hypothetical protein ACFFBD_12400, partial [Candidatus Hodarchaeota archaeon]
LYKMLEKTLGIFGRFIFKEEFRYGYNGRTYVSIENYLEERTKNHFLQNAAENLDIKNLIDYENEKETLTEAETLARAYYDVYGFHGLTLRALKSLLQMNQEDRDNILQREIGNLEERGLERLRGFYRIKYGLRMLETYVKQVIGGRKEKYNRLGEVFEVEDLAVIRRIIVELGLRGKFVEAIGNLADTPTEFKDIFSENFNSAGALPDSTDLTYEIDTKELLRGLELTSASIFNLFDETTSNKKGKSILKNLFNLFSTEKENNVFKKENQAIFNAKNNLLDLIDKEFNSLANLPIERENRDAEVILKLKQKNFGISIEISTETKQSLQDDKYLKKQPDLDLIDKVKESLEPHLENLTGFKVLNAIRELKKTLDRLKTSKTVERDNLTLVSQTRELVNYLNQGNMEQAADEILTVISKQYFGVSPKVLKELDSSSSISLVNNLNNLRKKLLGHVKNHEYDKALELCTSQKSLFEGIKDGHNMYNGLISDLNELAIDIKDQTSALLEYRDALLTFPEQIGEQDQLEKALRILDSLIGIEGFLGGERRRNEKDLKENLNSILKKMSGEFIKEMDWVMQKKNIEELIKIQEETKNYAQNSLEKEFNSLREVISGFKPILRKTGGDKKDKDYFRDAEILTLERLKIALTESVWWLMTDYILGVRDLFDYEDRDTDIIREKTTLFDVFADIMNKRLAKISGAMKYSAMVNLMSRFLPRLPNLVHTAKIKTLDKSQVDQSIDDFFISKDPTDLFISYGTRKIRPEEFIGRKKGIREILENKRLRKSDVVKNIFTNLATLGESKIKKPEIMESEFKIEFLKVYSKRINIGGALRKTFIHKIDENLLYPKTPGRVLIGKDISKIIRTFVYSKVDPFKEPKDRIAPELMLQMIASSNSAALKDIDINDVSESMLTNSKKVVKSIIDSYMHVLNQNGILAKLFEQNLEYTNDKEPFISIPKIPVAKDTKLHDEYLLDDNAIIGIKLGKGLPNTESITLRQYIWGECQNVMEKIFSGGISLIKEINFHRNIDLLVEAIKNFDYSKPDPLLEIV